jgi:hypothetical protein
VQLDASVVLLEAEGNTRQASTTRAQAADKRSEQQSTSSKIEALEQKQEDLQRQFQALSACFKRSEEKLALQHLENEQWTVAEGLLQVQHLAAPRSLHRHPFVVVQLLFSVVEWWPWWSSHVERLFNSAPRWSTTWSSVSVMWRCETWHVCDGLVAWVFAQSLQSRPVRSQSALGLRA